MFCVNYCWHKTCVFFLFFFVHTAFLGIFQRRTLTLCLFLGWPHGLLPQWCWCRVAAAWHSLAWGAHCATLSLQLWFGFTASPIKNKWRSLPPHNHCVSQKSRQAEKITCEALFSIKAEKDWKLWNKTTIVIKVNDFYRKKGVSCGWAKACQNRKTRAYQRRRQSHSLLSAEIISFPFLRETEIKLLAGREHWLKLFNKCAGARQAAGFHSHFCGLRKPPEAPGDDNQTKAEDAKLPLSRKSRHYIQMSQRRLIVLLILSPSLVRRGHFCGDFAPTDVQSHGVCCEMSRRLRLSLLMCWAVISAEVKHQPCSPS